MSDTPFIATQDYAVEYDRCVHPRAQSPEIEAVEKEFSERLVPLLLQDYLQRRAAAESPKPFRAKKRDEKNTNRAEALFSIVFIEKYGSIKSGTAHRK